MNLDYLELLPPWQDDRFNLVAEGDEWKENHKREAAKALYNQWREVFNLVIAFADNLTNNHEENIGNSHAEITKNLIYENAMIVAPKIVGAVGCGLYILQMENASIIRTNCIQMMEQVGVAVMLSFAEEKHKEVIEEELQKFKILFKSWLDTFQKDEYADEWGLFG